MPLVFPPPRRSSKSDYPRPISQCAGCLPTRPSPRAEGVRPPLRRRARLGRVDARAAVRARLRRRDVLHDVPARTRRARHDPDVHEHLVHAARRLRRARRVREEARRQEGRQSTNKEFTLVEEECIAACANAPCAVVGTKYFLDLTPGRRSAKVIAELEANPQPEGGGRLMPAPIGHQARHRALRQRGRADRSPATSSAAATRRCARRSRCGPRTSSTRSRRRTCAAAAAPASRPA